MIISQMYIILTIVKLNGCCFEKSGRISAVVHSCAPQNNGCNSGDVAGRLAGVANGNNVNPKRVADIGDVQVLAGVGKVAAAGGVGYADLRLQNGSISHVQAVRMPTCWAAGAKPPTPLAPLSFGCKGLRA